MSLKKYKLTIRKTRGATSAWSPKLPGAFLTAAAISKDSPPKLGEQQRFLIAPPIVETIIQVEEIQND